MILQRRKLLKAVVALAAYNRLGGSAQACMPMVPCGVSPTTASTPKPPGAGPFTNIAFFDDFTSLGTIDIASTGAPGYLWYPQTFCGYPQTPASDISVSNSILTISGTGAGQIGINTAVAWSSSPTHYIGRAFGGGGYFEASIAFDPTKGQGTTEWPAFWCEALQHVIAGLDGGTSEQWPGQAAGYVNFVELDIFEAYNGGVPYTGKTSYLGTIHDWSGFGPPYTEVGNYSDDTVNVGAIDWSVFHTYGCLWVPGTNTTPGYVRWYFDNILAGPTIYWQGPVTSPPLQTTSTSTYSPTTPAQAAQNYAILDQQQLAIRLSTDGTWPMKVDWVRIWK